MKPASPPLKAAASLLFAALSCWAVMAILFSGSASAARWAAAAAFCVAALAAALAPKGPGRKTAWFLAAFLPVLGWWLALKPSNGRDWDPSCAVLPYAEIYGSSVTVRNIRDFSYRTADDFAPRYYDRTFSLGDLRSLDLFLVHWGSPHIAHAMLSFGFGKGGYLCFSIETRREKGEEYSAVRGFFKQYEMTYVAADERDAVRLRTNFRGEQVYLYRLKAEPGLRRAIFLDYLRVMNELRATPRWYGVITNNCAVGAWRHMVPYYPRVRFDRRILLSGHADELAYELGVVDDSLPFAELKRRSLINDRAVAAGESPRFSELIREGLPGFAPGRELGRR